MKPTIWLVGILAADAYLAEIVRLSSIVKNYRREQGGSIKKIAQLLVLCWVIFIGLATVLFWKAPNIFSGAILIILVFALVSLIAFKLGTQKSFKIDSMIAKLVAPLNRKILQYLDNPLAILANRLIKPDLSIPHTGLYDRQDLLGLLSKQVHQSDNQINNQEIALIRQALAFGEKNLEQIMHPIDRVRMVLADASIGPHLMDELHKLSSKLVPVVNKSGSKKIAGVLYIGNLLDFEDGQKVGDVMNRDLLTLNQRTSLPEALNKIAEHSSKIILVVDDLGKTLGIVYEPDIIKQLVGVENFHQTD